MNVKDRLIKFIEYKNLNKNKFEKTCGLSTGYIGNMRVSIQPDKIKSIATNFPELNTGWLLTGEGEMLKEQNDTIYSDRQEQDFLVPLLPISAQGGSLDDFVISVKDSDCEKVISPIKGADFAMTVSGDSMAPEYPSGSQILIKKINQRIFIDWGKVYVLDTCNGSIIKIVTQSEKDECIRCISINPDQRRYAPFDVPFCEINGMYRVLLLMSIK